MCLTSFFSKQWQILKWHKWKNDKKSINSKRRDTNYEELNTFHYLINNSQYIYINIMFVTTKHLSPNVKFVVQDGGDTGKGLSIPSHIRMREKMRMQDDEVGEWNSNEQSQIQSDRRFLVIFDSNLHSGPSPFDHSYYPYKMTWTFVWKTNCATTAS